IALHFGLHVKRGWGEDPCLLVAHEYANAKSRRLADDAASLSKLIKGLDISISQPKDVLVAVHHDADPVAAEPRERSLQRTSGRLPHGRRRNRYAVLSPVD